MQHLLLVGFLGFSAVASQAEVVFYRPKINIAKVDCAARKVILNNPRRTELIFPKITDENYSDFCSRISGFSESASSSESGPQVTIMTVESKAIGDSIIQEEIVGIVDGDNVISTRSIVDSDLAYNRYCGRASSASRSALLVCMYISQRGKYFVELESPQSYRFSKPSQVISVNDKIILVSKKSNGSTDFQFTADTRGKGESSIGASVDFGQGAVELILTKRP